MPVARALTIATSDSGGGAGSQADLKAFAAAGVHGVTAIVALTAQSTTAETAIHELPPELVLAQLDAVATACRTDTARRILDEVHINLYDALAALDPDTIDRRARVA